MRKSRELPISLNCGRGDYHTYLGFPISEIMLLKLEYRRFDPLVEWRKRLHLFPDGTDSYKYLLSLATYVMGMFLLHATRKHVKGPPKNINMKKKLGTNTSISTGSSLYRYFLRWMEAYREL